MSVTGLSSNPNRPPHNNSFHWRNNSGELDVFEAARYFSAANEHNNLSDFAGESGRRAARMSLDMPAVRNPINLDSFPTKENNNKYKQPSSPGGRLASFLNSIFNQTASKKKKSKLKSSTKDGLDREESPGGRKRRSSISHFRITAGNSVAPPAKTPTKTSYRELSDHRKAKKETNDDEEFRFSNGNVCDDEERRFRKFGYVDDGADSDSSSDLFDLPNYDLDLPVYGTTNMDRIKIGTPISSGAML